MAVKKYKPTTPGQRGMTGYTFEEITKVLPERSLLKPLRKSGGRNAYGRVTVRHRGGRHRRRIRIVDFKREKFGIPARVAAMSAAAMANCHTPIRIATTALAQWHEQGALRRVLSNFIKCIPGHPPLTWGSGLVFLYCHHFTPSKMSIVSSGARVTIAFL